MKKILGLVTALALTSATALAATPRAAEDINGVVESSDTPVPKVRTAVPEIKHAKKLVPPRHSKVAKGKQHRKLRRHRH